MLSKCFYSKKVIKIKKTPYQEKVLPPKLFSKKSKLAPQFWPKVFRFSKNGHFAPKMAKITKKSKIKQIFDVNFERFEMVFWKTFQRTKSCFYHSFSIFYSFLTLWTSKRHKKTAWNMIILLSSKILKRLIRKVLDLLQKCNECWKKNSTFSLVHGLLPNFFSAWYNNIIQRKTSGNLSYYWKILKKQYFHGKTWLASFKEKKRAH